MSLLAILVIVVLLILVFPRTGAYSANFGYAPFSIGGVLLVIFVIWILFFGGLGGLRLR